jgi:hypothetical protein
MPGKEPLLPSRELMKQHLLSALEAYWPAGRGMVEALPIAAVAPTEIVGALRLKEVTLPDWGAACGVDGVLLVPVEACQAGARWDQVDWWLAAFLLLECWHERVWETRHSVIHSYSFRLTGWDERVWERAWVNRIALLLRVWASRGVTLEPTEVLGPLPEARVIMTHDVDAVAKTVAIRIKQGAFHFFNALRLFRQARWSDAWSRLQKANRFVWGGDSWWNLGQVMEMEREAGIRSSLNFYADSRPKTPKRWLFDPGYAVSTPRFKAVLNELVQGGWTVGLHQSFDSWNSPDVMCRQRELLQSATPAPVESCRQHWLRFGWRDTWATQAAAGLKEDTTLMFNDRMGFRAAAALSWSPWNPAAGKVHPLRTLPTILMDSHVYDYQAMTAPQRCSQFRYWLEELKAVSGTAAVLWHTQTLSSDYGWTEGFMQLIESMKRVGICSNP